MESQTFAVVFNVVDEKRVYGVRAHPNEVSPFSVFPVAKFLHDEVRRYRPVNVECVQEFEMRKWYFRAKRECPLFGQSEI